MSDRTVERYIQRRSKTGRYRARVPDGGGKGTRTIAAWRDTLEEARADREKLIDARHVQNAVEDNAEPEQQKSVKFEATTNTATARSVGLIHTLPELLKECEVDTDVWKALRWSVKPYAGWAKNERASLKWSNGQITEGFKESDGIEVVQLYSMEATFVRTEPVYVFPTVQPVEAVATYKPPPEPRTDGISTALIWCDSQIGYSKDVRTAKLDPFHDRQALDILVQIAQYLQPDRIDGLGDTLDLTDWTDKFMRKPEFYQTTQPAVQEAHWWLSQLRHAVPSAQIRLHEGNHEARITRALNTNLQAALDLKPADEIELPPPLSARRLLGLDGLQVQWIGDYPNGCDWLNAGIQLYHGNVAAAETARRIVAQSVVCQVYAHTHRCEVFSRTIDTRRGQVVVQAINPGCTCRTEYGIVPGHDRKHSWQQGLAVIRYEEDGDARPEIGLVGIENGRALFDGHVFEARDRVGDLADDVPGWNW